MDTYLVTGFTFGSSFGFTSNYSIYLDVSATAVI